MTAPIVGSTSIKHLEDLIDAVHVKLTPEEIEAISEGYKPKAIVRLPPSSSYPSFFWQPGR